MYETKLTPAVTRAIIAAGNGTKIVAPINPSPKTQPTPNNPNNINDTISVISLMRRYQNGEIVVELAMLPPLLLMIIIAGLGGKFNRHSSESQNPEIKKGGSRR